MTMFISNYVNSLIGKLLFSTKYDESIKSIILGQGSVALGLIVCDGIR